MWFWKKKKPVVDPVDMAEAEDAIQRATQSIEETKARAPEVLHLLNEFKTADPFGYNMFEAMRGKR